MMTFYTSRLLRAPKDMIYLLTGRIAVANFQNCDSEVVHKIHKTCKNRKVCQTPVRIHGSLNGVQHRL